jgi:hypothetical protein
MPDEPVTLLDNVGYRPAQAAFHAHPPGFDRVQSLAKNTVLAADLVTTRRPMTSINRIPLRRFGQRPAYRSQFGEGHVSIDNPSVKRKRRPARAIFTVAEN